MKDYILLPRNLLEWQYYLNPDMVRLLLHLLLTADDEGVVVTTIKQLSTDTNITVQAIRTCLDKLETNKQINKQTTNKNSIITICNYDSYTTPQKGKQQTNNKQNNKQNSNNLERRKSEFTESLRPYVDIYGRDMVNGFWKYWTEPNKSHTKMRYELQRTWDTKLRLETWANNLLRNGSDRTNSSAQQQRTAKVADRINQLLAEEEQR